MQLFRNILGKYIWFIVQKERNISPERRYKKRDLCARFDWRNNREYGL